MARRSLTAAAWRRSLARNEDTREEHRAAEGWPGCRPEDASGPGGPPPPSFVPVRKAVPEARSVNNPQLPRAPGNAQGYRRVRRRGHAPPVLIGAGGDALTMG